MGWLMGLEPTTTGITILSINQASMRVPDEFMGNSSDFHTPDSLGCKLLFPTKYQHWGHY
jgi:hypothetical protein